MVEGADTAGKGLGGVAEGVAVGVGGHGVWGVGNNVFFRFIILIQRVPSDFEQKAVLRVGYMENYLGKSRFAAPFFIVATLGHSPFDILFGAWVAVGKKIRRFAADSTNIGPSQKLFLAF